MDIDLTRAPSTIIPDMRNIKISANSMSISSPFQVALFLSSWVPNGSLELSRPEDPKKARELESSEAGRQVTFIAGVLKTIACHHELVKNATFEQFKTPKVVKDLGALIKLEL
ncbi:hypothetical protein CALVIDRAFT_533914 [Calocera viscosa TUFC12733]|uniref:Uncharacterized protein n=1 Tax=Calocera viscosa (strain TUFC12733) TaxID=1330018 RepID=A0A167QV34_CALVF|nr:hypothetical protein CALVIDRAFT_533914 [Calocera viscosa TUFC12733]